MPIPADLYKRLHRYRWLLALALGVFVADQVSKWIIAATLPYNTPDHVTVIPGFFFIVHIGNPGAAWGLFAGMSMWLAVLAVGTLAMIYLFRRHLELRRTAMQVSFGLLCGGIVGNLVDRLIHGHVIDFLLFTFGRLGDWPAFNIADSAICVGVGLYIVQSFRSSKEERTA